MQDKTFTLEEIATLTQSRLIGSPEHKISNVADLDSATANDISFLAIPQFDQASRYEQAMLRSQAGAIFVSENAATVKGKNLLVAKNPSQAFQMLVEAFYGSENESSGFRGVHPTAVIHPSSKLGDNVHIGPYAVIDQHVVIGNNTTIGAACSVGPFSTVGSDTVIHPHVTIRERCHIGNRVILQPGVVIGSCGFGFITDKTGKHTKLKQVGNVVVEDDVEIGANSTIDRARFKTTRIGRGTKIDNLVQIAHAVVVGQDNIIVAQTGIAGSTETGKNVVLGGQTAIAGHLKLASGVMLAARSGVTKSINKAGKYGGIPATSLADYNRTSVYLRNIEHYVNEIKELKSRLDELER